MQATTEIEVPVVVERTHHIVLLFAPTIFLSAFLLFCSEPMVGKMMLPLLGGAASVWITCLLFFQLMHFAARPDAAASSHPTLWLLGQLIKSVGIPFGVVSTTAPLLQNWLSKTATKSGRDPYFLYAVSNAGSLLALLSYPLLIEPRWGVHVQSLGWFTGYG